MYSSSLRFCSGVPTAVTLMRRRSANVAGSRRRSSSVPSRHDEIRPVVRQPPAFALVLEAAARRERLLVVHERDARLPRQLNQIGFPNGDALAEIRPGDVPLLDDFARLELHLANGRTAVQAGAFVQKPVDVLQPLREGLRIVRVHVDDAVAVHGKPAREAVGWQASARRQWISQTAASSAIMPPGPVPVLMPCRRRRELVAPSPVRARSAAALELDADVADDHRADPPP